MNKDYLLGHIPDTIPEIVDLVSKTMRAKELSETDKLDIVLYLMGVLTAIYKSKEPINED